MKQNKIMNAYNALARLYSQSLPVKKSMEIWNLKKSLNDQYQFQIDREKKYIDEYNGRFTEKGELVFEKKEEAIGFHKALNELAEIEVDIQVTPVEIVIETAPNLEISAEDIENLDGFVCFK